MTDERPSISDDLIDELVTTAIGNIRLVPVEPQWQPIETAPKHGQPYILLCDASVHPEDFDAYVTVGFWTELHAGRVANDEWIWADWNAGLDDEDVWATVSFRPTHWMPLPPPPVKTELIP